MKKSILNLGKTLNKVEQKNIGGGLNGQNCPTLDFFCDSTEQCCTLLIPVYKNFPHCLPTYCYNYK